MAFLVHFTIDITSEAIRKLLVTYSHILGIEVAYSHMIGVTHSVSARLFDGPERAMLQPQPCLFTAHGIKPEHVGLSWAWHQYCNGDRLGASCQV